MPARAVRSDAIADRLAQLVAKHLAAANLLGRLDVVKRVKRKTGRSVPLAMSSRLHLQFAEGDDPTDASLVAGFSLNLPATGAAGYLRGLTPVTKDTFDGLSQQYQRDAFTVAGTTDARLIERVRDALADVLEKGGTEKDFAAAVAQLTTDAGVEAINSFALDTVFSTTLAKAYSLGRYEQMTDQAVIDALPYWQYLTVGDDRVRPEHAVLDGFMARAEDPVWGKIYPPNGFNCRCIVIAALAEEASADADEPGLARLPLLARLKVPQPGFGKVF